MENNRSVNSSGEVGTPGAFTKVTGQHNITCRCCEEIQDYSDQLWEFRNNAWFCTRCAELAEIMLVAGQQRSAAVFGYLINPVITRNGFDL